MPCASRRLRELPVEASLPSLQPSPPPPFPSSGSTAYLCVPRCPQAHAGTQRRAAVPSTWFSPMIGWADPCSLSASLPTSPCVPCSSFHAVVPGRGWLGTLRRRRRPSFTWDATKHTRKACTGAILRVLEHLGWSILGGWYSSVGKPSSHILTE